MRYKLLTKNDIEQVVKIHIKSFEGFFLTTLGENFLKMYYKSSLKHPDSISIGSFDEDDQMNGFSFGCTRSKGYHTRLIRKNFMTFLFLGIIILFSKPNALFRLLRNMEKNNINDDGNYAELLSIAVSPNSKELGIGKYMIAHFEAEVKAKGCFKVALTTDYYNNDNVVAFYKKNGYKVFYVFNTYPNRRMYKLIKEL